MHICGVAMHVACSLNRATRTQRHANIVGVVQEMQIVQLCLVLVACYYINVLNSIAVTSPASPALLRVLSSVLSARSPLDALHCRGSTVGPCIGGNHCLVCEVDQEANVPQRRDFEWPTATARLRPPRDQAGI